MTEEIPKHYVLESVCYYEIQLQKHYTSFKLLYVQTYRFYVIAQHVKKTVA